MEIENKKLEYQLQKVKCKHNIEEDKMISSFNMNSESKENDSDSENEYEEEFNFDEDKIRNAVD